MKIDGQAAPLVFSAAPSTPGSRVEGSQDQCTAQDAKARDLEQPPNLENIQQAVEFSNDVMRLGNYHLEFQVQEESHKCQVKVVDSDTGDIIREIPPDYMMKIAEQLETSINKEVGLLLDKTA